MSTPHHPSRFSKKPNRFGPLLGFVFQNFVFSAPAPHKTTGCADFQIPRHLRPPWKPTAQSRDTRNQERAAWRCARYMSRDSGQGTVRDRSLQDLEGLDWGEANFDSHLVKFPRSQSPGYFAMRSTGGWRWPAISCRLSGGRQIARKDRRKIDMMRSFVEFFVLNRRTSWTRNRNPSIPLEKELAAASWLRF